MLRKLKDSAKGKIVKHDAYSREASSRSAGRAYLNVRPVRTA